MERQNYSRCQERNLLVAKEQFYRLRKEIRGFTFSVDGGKKRRRRDKEEKAGNTSSQHHVALRIGEDQKILQDTKIGAENQKVSQQKKDNSDEERNKRKRERSRVDNNLHCSKTIPHHTRPEEQIVDQEHHVDLSTKQVQPRRRRSERSNKQQQQQQQQQKEDSDAYHRRNDITFAVRQNIGKQTSLPVLTYTKSDHQHNVSSHHHHQRANVVDDEEGYLASKEQMAMRYNNSTHGIKGEGSIKQQDSPKNKHHPSSSHHQNELPSGERVVITRQQLAKTRASGIESEVPHHIARSIARKRNTVSSIPTLPEIQTRDKSQNEIMAYYPPPPPTTKRHAVIPKNDPRLPEIQTRNTHNSHYEKRANHPRLQQQPYNTPILPRLRETGPVNFTTTVSMDNLQYGISDSSRPQTPSMRLELPQLPPRPRQRSASTRHTQRSRVNDSPQQNNY